MKIYFILTSLACLLATTTSAQQTLPIDPSTSIILWTGHAELGSYAPEGTVQLRAGRVTIKEKTIVRAMIIVDMKSIKQENARLVEHLKSDDFFDVERYPFSTIKIDKVVQGMAYGYLTIKGKTIPLQCPVITEQTPTVLKISGKTTIDRTKYGIIYNSGNFFAGLGDKAIRNNFDIEFSISIKR